MNELKHPNLIHLKEFFEDESNLYLVMECAAGGELFDRITERRHYTEKDAQLVAAQMMEAVAAIHNLDIVHADIKPDNFLFGSAADDSLKMIDFGQANRLKPGEKLHNVSGTPYYMSPQQVAQDYNKSCDLWSVGVVIYVMLYGYPPFYADDGTGLVFPQHGCWSLVCCVIRICAVLVLARWGVQTRAFSS